MGAIMKAITIAILATILPVQSALAGGKSAPAIVVAEEKVEEAREQLARFKNNGSEKSDIRMAIEQLHEAEEEADAIRSTSKTRAGKRINEADDERKPRKRLPRPFAEVERDTEEAREALNFARREGFGDDDLTEAEEALEEAEAEEDAIREERAETPARKEKPKGKAKPKSKSKPRSMEEVERDTEEAREALAHAREEGYGKLDLTEAEEALEEAEAEEEAIRAERKAKKPSKPKKKKPAKRSMAEIERETEEAREALQHAREEGYGKQDLTEAEEALEEAEAEEEGARADRKK